MLGVVHSTLQKSSTPKIATNELKICGELQWIDDIGGAENFASNFLKRKKDKNLPVFIPPEVKSQPFFPCSVLIMCPVVVG